MKLEGSLVLTALCLATLGGCAMLPGAGSSTEPVFSLEDQSRGDTVEVASVTLVEPGYVVVHDDVNGEPGPVLGHTDLLDAGRHEDVSISLDTASEGDGVWPMVHVDDGNGTYEFPGPDAPATLEGVPVMSSLTWR